MPLEILIADDFFARYQASIPGSFVDSNNTGLFQIPPDAVKNIKPLKFVFGGRMFTLSAKAQLVPQYQNVAWGGVEGAQYGYVGPLGAPSGEGLDFIIGQKFMERFYAVSAACEIQYKVAVLNGVVCCRSLTRRITALGSRLREILLPQLLNHFF